MGSLVWHIGTAFTLPISEGFEKSFLEYIEWPKAYVRLCLGLGSPDSFSSAFDDIAK
jgi:hypothetical protein